MIKSIKDEVTSKVFPLFEKSKWKEGYLTLRKISFDIDNNTINMNIENNFISSIFLIK